MLYSINQTTLVKWFKDEVRRQEITLLMQGLSPPQQQLCADESLLPARKLPSSPSPPPVNPHTIIEPKDTTGTVKYRARRKSSTPGPSGLNTPAATSPSVTVNPLSHLDPTHLMAALSSIGLANPLTTASSNPMAAFSSISLVDLPAAASSHPMTALSSVGLVSPPNPTTASSHPVTTLSSVSPVNPPTTVCLPHLVAALSPPGPSGLASSPSVSPLSSRTTVWRHKREREEGKISRRWKVYTCTVCGRPMTSEGHTQFRGQRYCPSAPGQMPQHEWLQKKKDEAARPSDPQ